jgi:sensor histidine kinase YesM
VQALIDYEPEKAKAMLEAFIEYLRATLDASRRTQATLGDELHLMQRYLTLMQVRMGTRLQFEIDASDELRTLPFAPLLLQPLVENAIKYGLEPKIDGGHVRIRAERVGNSVLLSVTDNGLGLNEKSSARKGAGVGLANVRARLQQLFGPQADVRVQARTDAAGTLATLRFETV